jgi:mitochondrial import inner membrane translocase subunit TIM13
MITQLKNEIHAQANLANAQRLMANINSACFAHCVPNPNSSLSTKEQGCMSACMEKYIEGWNAVNRAYVGRLQTEGKQLPGVGSAAGPHGFVDEQFGRG